jgi:ABC-type phosphate transport system ATPase subunit
MEELHPEGVWTQSDKREWSLNLCLSSECLRVVQIPNHRAVERLLESFNLRLQGHQQQRLSKARVAATEYRKQQTD